MARNVITAMFDGKKVVSASGLQTTNTQTVTSRGVQHNVGALSVVQEMLSAGTYADKVSIYAEGELALVIYLTATQFAAFEVAVMPTLSIIGLIGLHTFDQM